MVKIVRASDCKNLGMTDTPAYIKRAKNGCFVLCSEPEALGIALNGINYRLLGREVPEDMAVLEIVMLKATDAGAEIRAIDQAVADADGIIVNQEYRLTLLELGLTNDCQTN